MQVVVHDPHVLLRIVGVHLDLVRTARALPREDLVVLRSTTAPSCRSRSTTKMQCCHFWLVAPVAFARQRRRRTSRRPAAESCRAARSRRDRAFRRTRRRSIPRCIRPCPESAAASWRRPRRDRTRLRRPFPASGPTTGTSASSASRRTQRFIRTSYSPIRRSIDVFIAPESGMNALIC